MALSGTIGGEDRTDRGGADRRFLGAMAGALGLPAAAADRVTFEAPDSLPSAFAATALAAAAIGAAALTVSELVATVGDPPPVRVDRRLASLWFGSSLKPIKWALPSPWDPIAGDYRAADGWIRLHTNAPRHRRSIPEWADHPQGRAVAAEPLIAIAPAGEASFRWRPDPARPLAGQRVLDLTRVLAGPVATRFLAGYGADVLRIDPPDWDEPAVEPEVTLGKICARLDLRQVADRARLERLIADADLLIHGYRPDALDRLGFGEDVRRALNPALVDVRLDAYGWSGPWSGRRGFDSLVQMSTGIAAAGMAWRGAEKPVPLPVQALDYATGYMMAAAAVRGLAIRLAEGRAISARLSLARTAALLLGVERDGLAAAGLSPTEADYSGSVEATDWGPAHRALPPVSVAGAAIAWDRPASRLGSAAPEWSAPR